MISRFATLGFACLMTTEICAAGNLAPLDGYNIPLAGFDGVAYYTVEQDGYKVVATLAPRSEGTPIRFVSTLQPGQRVIISVPQAVDQASLDFVIVRDGDTLLVSESGATMPLDFREPARTAW
jgi:hypothetical protein